MVLRLVFHLQFRYTDTFWNVKKYHYSNICRTELAEATSLLAFQCNKKFCMRKNLMLKHLCFTLVNLVRTVSRKQLVAC